VAIDAKADMHTDSLRWMLDLRDFTASEHRWSPVRSTARFGDLRDWHRDRDGAEPTVRRAVVLSRP
jgi:hypothetical protein